MNDFKNFEHEFMKLIVDESRNTHRTNIHDLITNKYLQPNLYIKIDHGKTECSFVRRKMLLPPITDLDELHEHMHLVDTDLMSLTLLLEHLESERFIALAGDSKKDMIGSKFDDDYEAEYHFFYPELSEKLIWLSSKDIIPLRRLYEYVENGFKTSEQFALDEQLRKQEKSIRWMKFAVYVTAGGLIVSAIFGILSLRSTAKMRLENKEIAIKILNDSFKILSVQDTIKISFPTLKATLDSAISKTLLAKDSMDSVKRSNKKTG